MQPIHAAPATSSLYQTTNLIDYVNRSSMPIGKFGMNIHDNAASLRYPLWCAQPQQTDADSRANTSTNRDAWSAKWAANRFDAKEFSADCVNYWYYQKLVAPPDRFECETTMKNRRLYHTVADKIKKLINDGSFPPGSRLPGERDLAERFDVSRVTIREAEIALQALGYLQIKTGSGVYVLDNAEKENGGLPNVTAFELTEARLLFESEAVALAARVIDNETLGHLQELVERMSSTDPADEEDSVLADREFHLTLAASCGNSAIQYVIETLWKMRTELQPVREVHAAICAKETAGERGTEHSDILEALKNRDSAGAREAMRRHFRHLLESMIDVTEEQAMQELRQRVTQSRERYLKRAQG